MFKNKRMTYFALIAIFAVILFLEKRQFDSNLAGLESDPVSPTSVHRDASSTTQDQDRDGSNNTNNSTVQLGANKSANDLPHVDSVDSLKKFEAWAQAEAKSLEERSNQQNKEELLRATAQKLSAGEIEILKQNSVSTKVTANERIFSTYLLSLGSESTAQALASIAQHDLSLPSPQPVHSLNESTLMQEKALRTMAIDELFSRASQDPNLRAGYMKMAAQIRDPGLRKYALKRFEEFK
ncbi:MAG: hypothetical protein H7256_07910 [Bdellovibrio sp.]|nr:hypothetical protein [Bdellovibrio sp.]